MSRDRDEDSMIDEGWDVLYDGVGEGRCSKCNHGASRVEPDANYPCPEEDCDGRIRSVLGELGMI